MDGRYPPKRSCRPWMHANKHHMAYWHDFLGRASSLRSMKHLYVLRYRCLEVRGLWRPVVQGLNRRGESAKSFVRQKCGGFSVIVCKTHNEGRFICTKFSSARRNWRARGCIFAHFFVRVGKQKIWRSLTQSPQSPQSPRPEIPEIPEIPETNSIICLIF